MKDISLMIGEIKFNYRVGVLLVKDGKFLVEVNPKAEYVYVPSGKVKTTESSKEALKREMVEELGFEIDIDRLKTLSLFENFFEGNNINYHEIFILYKYKLNKDELTDNFLVNYDSKNNYYKWIDISEVRDINILPKEVKNIVDSDEIRHFINK